MNAIKRITAGVLANRRLSWVVALLLAVDILLIGLFLLWAIAEHYHLRNNWAFGRDEFSMGEGQLTEQWGFVKLALASVFLLIIAGSRRQFFFWGLAALIVVMLLSDALQFHEQINSALHPPLAAVFDRHHIDVFMKFALAAVPLSAMAFGLWSAPSSDRQQMVWLAAPAIMLGFCASIVDFIHGLIEQHFEGGRTIGNLIEEGGEGILATAVLVSALFYLWPMLLHSEQPVGYANR